MIFRFENENGSEHNIRNHETSPTSATLSSPILKGLKVDLRYTDPFEFSLRERNETIYSWLRFLKMFQVLLIFK